VLSNGGWGVKKIVWIGLAVAALASPAFAADMPTKAPAFKAPMPAFNWTGCYIGAQIGYGWGKSEHTFSNGAPTDNSSPRGALGGGHAGCNYQFPSSNIVVGVEGDYEAADLTGDFVNTTGATSVGSAKMKSDGSIRARVGWAWDRSLFYATGGWAFARYDFGGGPVPPPPCCGYSASPSGWTAGVGWEYAFTNIISGRIEYRRTDYGTSSGGLPPIFPTVIMPVRNTTDVVRLGISIKFWPGLL
jgi:outer membrane immunogenic protein